ncbi:hypothetical protein RRG08_044276 [Elysia crispata]|uniref:Uncharacterized protein n=1 Tax=Elysia crispata TaxID=231223 RepID=A0AAE0XWP8_9GAST|nr:hypothetical protein RRG08_044276 [Elysia crispata]
MRGKATPFMPTPEPFGLRRRTACGCILWYRMRGKATPLMEFFTPRNNRQVSAPERGAVPHIREVTA